MEEDIAAPSQLDLLIAAWAERDSQYARFTKPLEDITIRGIRNGRKRESLFLPPEDRAFAWGRAATWYPPEHGQGLS